MRYCCAELKEKGGKGRMLKAHSDKKYRLGWKNGVEVFDWWTGFDSNQLSFFDGEEDFS
ncbi:MAG: hypothetical protein K2J08_01925 [Ruminococcus sp.]|nr:hypothetical protein [Ruminococcus sp.]